MMKTLRIAVALVGVLLAAISLAAGALKQGSRVGALNDAWLGRATQDTGGSTITVLFDSAVHAQLIYFDPTNNMIGIKTKREFNRDNLLAEQTAGSVEPANGSLPRSLFTSQVAANLLWKSRGPGAQIRAILEDFNAGRAVFGVRDSGLTVPCRVLERDACAQAAWAISTVLPQAGNAIGAVTLTGTLAQSAFEVDSATFSALADPAAGFSNWTAAKGRDISGATFQADVLQVDPDTQGRVLIDVIGTAARFPSTASILHFCIDDRSGVTALRVRACDDAQRAVAHRVIFEGPPDPVSASIQAQAVTLPLLPPAVAKHVFVAPTKGLPSQINVRLSDRLTLACDAQAQECRPRLRVAKGKSRLARDLELRSQIETAISLPTGQELDPRTLAPTADPAPTLPETVLSVRDAEFLRLTGPQAYELTEQAVALGLAPAIGIPGVSFGTYLGLLENMPVGVKAQDLDLTFDANMQETVLGRVETLIETGVFPGGRTPLLDGHADKMRAAFVMVDLKNTPEQGAVRVAVGYPFFNRNLNLWDLQALARGPEGRSRIAAAAWRGLDSRFQPGSSLKTLSALSLARSASGMHANIPQDVREKLDKVLLGEDGSFYSRQIGLPLEARALTVQTGRAQGWSTFTVQDRGGPVAANRAGVAAACGRANAATFGVCEALAGSSNMWFAQMALLENTDTIEALYSATYPNRAYTGLAQTFIALGLHQPLPLVRLPGGASAEDSRAPRMEGPNLPSAPALTSGLGPDADPAVQNELNIALNAYGQAGAQVTPLAMATLNGALALGHTVRPFIARARDSLPAPRSPILPGDARSAEYRDAIIDGVAAVVSGGGTGQSAFRRAGEGAAALGTRVFAKTGTATLNAETEPRIYTHWFTGWINDKDGTPQYGFACALSHVNASDAPCATMTAAILLDLQAAGQLQ